jgi:acyl-coenzyme A synthetase/AMP-(fatty) acid ligase
LPGTEARIVDGDLAPVAPGEPGQLLIHGPTLMSHYWRAPDQTARAVLTGSDGRSWYATGDQVYLNAAGELEFVGREDDQVKVHGYRVELGEVERALRLVPAVQECSVIAVRDDAGPALVAFVRLHPPHELRSLPDQLRATIPHYMIPYRFVPIDGELPRLSNGKVDRVALAAMA